MIVPSTYLWHPPTVSSSGGRGGYPERPVEVRLYVNILNIDRIDTVHMMFALTMEFHLQWRDHRLRYKNLKEGLVQNQLPEKEYKHIWRPNVVFKNAKIGTMKEDHFMFMVKKDSSPQPFSYASPVEGKKFLF